jgi:clan AA aspartic protease (TIGR02281 family)
MGHLLQNIRPSRSTWHRLRLGSLLVLGLASPVSAALYSCTSPAGATVLTDTPAGLRNCTLLGPSRHSPPVRPKRTPDPISQPPNPANIGQHPPPQSSAFSVPLERLGSLWVVPILINDTRPAQLILDTGASHTILSYAIARDLGLWAQSSATSMTMHTAGGTVRADVLTIALISVGGAEVRNSLAAIHDLPQAPPGIEGLLGQDFLRHFEVTLNAERGELRLRPAK